MPLYSMMKLVLEATDLGTNDGQAHALEAVPQQTSEATNDGPIWAETS